MGKQTLARKAELVDAVESLLDQSQLVMVIDYQGMSVPDMGQLRNQLRPTDSVCMVVKNTLMNRAIATRDSWTNVDKFLTGQTAFIMVKGDVAGAIKAYQDFQKKAKKSEFRGAVFGGTTLTLEQLKAVADLPPKEVLMAQVAGGLNAIATRLAVGVKEVPTQLGRAVNEVPSSLGRAIQAVADQKKEAA